MKKTLFIIAVAGLAMASCKKSKTCTCTLVKTDSNGKVTTGQPVVTVYTKIKSGDAKNNCVSYSKTTNITFGGSIDNTSESNTCTLN